MKRRLAPADSESGMKREILLGSASFKLCVASKCWASMVDPMGPGGSFPRRLGEALSILGHSRETTKVRATKAQPHSDPSPRAYYTYPSSFAPQSARKRSVSKKERHLCGLLSHSALFWPRIKPELSANDACLARGPTQEWGQWAAYTYDQRCGLGFRATSCVIECCEGISW